MGGPKIEMVNYFLFQTNKLDVQNEKTIPLTNIKCQFFLPQLTTPPHDI
jgi:hypothetical protein